MKYLKFVVETNALGSVSANVYRFPVSEFESGREVPLPAPRPDHYAGYVSPIYARLSDDGEAIEIISKEYGDGRLPLDDDSARWHSPTIGLSYACCQAFVNITEQD